MFNLAIDSKLRGSDVLAIKVDDVAASGYTERSRNRDIPLGYVSDAKGDTDTTWDVSSRRGASRRPSGVRLAAGANSDTPCASNKSSCPMSRNTPTTARTVNCRRASNSRVTNRSSVSGKLSSGAPVHLP
jgi:hypothetical protein